MPGLFCSSLLAIGRKRLISLLRFFASRSIIRVYVVFRNGFSGGAGSCQSCSSLLQPYKYTAVNILTNASRLGSSFRLAHRAPFPLPHNNSNSVLHEIREIPQVPSCVRSPAPTEDAGVMVLSGIRLSRFLAPRWGLQGAAPWTPSKSTKHQG